MIVVGRCKRSTRFRGAVVNNNLDRLCEQLRTSGLSLNARPDDAED